MNPAVSGTPPCGSAVAVECWTLDRENPVTNPLHIMAPLMATRDVVAVSRHGKNKILVLDTWQ